MNSIGYSANDYVGNSKPKEEQPKEALGLRIKHYNNWVESYARNHGIPLEWVQKGVRKEDYVRPKLKAMERKKQFGVYFILKSMEQGSTFRSVNPKYPTADPNYRIINRPSQN